MTIPGRHHRTRAVDRGSVLVLVLVFTVIIGMVIAAAASYATTGLRYGRVVEARADRLAAADGGLRYAIQKLKKVGHHECPTINPPDVNGATVTLTCTPVGASFDDTEGYALVLTGEGVPGSTALMSASSGAAVAKRIGGLVYMNRLHFHLQSSVQFENGQMQYSVVPATPDPASDPCPTSHSILNGGGKPVLFSDDHYGIVCTTQPWSRDAHPTDDPSTQFVNEQGKFAEPLKNVPTTAALPPTTNGGCKVFFPGVYTSPPVLGTYNYFRSGDYLFDGFTLTISNQKVTAGRVLDGNGSTQAIPNETCNSARSADNISNVTEAGATFYLSNDAKIEVLNNGTFEVLRRKQGRSYVGIHVLDNSLAYGEDVLFQAPGGNKDMAIHGMVWAPLARITFGEVANIAKAQLLGGAVISNVVVDAAANTEGLVIAVEPGDITGLLQLDSIATTPDGRSTTIRSIVDYRPSTKYAAATSWRVID
jgi:hypothetical protein